MSKLYDLFDKVITKLTGKMDKENPEATGSFSLNRSANSVVGKNSIAMGSTTTASGSGAVALGPGTKASGQNSIALGAAATTGENARGGAALGSGASSNSIGAIALGQSTIASSQYQTAQGKFNVEDTENKYAYIFGAGNNATSRKNIHTMDWDGNTWYAGKVTAGADPENAMDLTTKQYVDKVASGGSGGGMSQTTADARYLQLSGGKVNGSIETSQISANVGALVASAEKNNGDNLMACIMRDITRGNAPGFGFKDINTPINMPVQLGGIDTPNDRYDAANKQYVDDMISLAITGAISASY